MQVHRKLTVLGVLLLVATFLLDNYNDQQEKTLDTEFNYAYITGILMIVVFSFSFFMFSKINQGNDLDFTDLAHHPYILMIS